MAEVATNLHQLRTSRLATQTSELRKLLEFLQALPHADPVGIEFAKKSLQALEGSTDLQEGWAHCSQAYRFLLWSMDQNQLEARRAVLRREAYAKLGNWRKEAVLDLIGRDEQHQKPIAADALSLAQYLLDQHFANVYFKLDVAATRIRSLSWVLPLTALVLLGVSWLLDPSASDSFLFSFQTTGLILLTGAIGATVSNALSVLGFGGKIPALLGEYANWFVRLPLGALSAAAFIALLQSGLLPLTPPTNLGLYAWALVGGFSDQLLNRAIASVEKSIEK